MRTQKISTLAASIAVVATLAACSSEPRHPDTLPAVSSGMGAQTTQFGRVIDIRSTERKGVSGRILGAVIGAAVGSQVGSGSGRTAATGLGAVGGAVAGNQVDERRADHVYRVSVRFDDGTTRQFDFERVDDLRVGDRERWENGQVYRM